MINNLMKETKEQREEREEREQRIKEQKRLSHPFFATKPTFGEKAADKITTWGGSWHFIFSFLILIAIWISLNVYGWIQEWDPYPFILLNLALSLLAAIQAPVILMSQNRQTQKDRIRAEYDYSVNRRSAREVSQINKQLDRIERKLNEHFKNNKKS